jgi:hypothetical protein
MICPSKSGIDDIDLLVDRRHPHPVGRNSTTASNPVLRRISGVVGFGCAEIEFADSFAAAHVTPDAGAVRTSGRTPTRYTMKSGRPFTRLYRGSRKCGRRSRKRRSSSARGSLRDQDLVIGPRPSVESSSHSSQQKQ